MSWSAVLAVIGLWGAVLLVVLGVLEQNSAKLEAGLVVALVGVGWSILSYRDRDTL